MHNRLQDWRPSKKEVQEGHSNADPEHEFIAEFHTIDPTSMRLSFQGSIREAYGLNLAVSSHNKYRFGN